MALPPVQYAKTPDGYSLAYAVRGSGTPLVFLTGSWGSLEFRRTRLEPLLDELARRFQLIQYDSRGQGASTRGLRDGVSLEDYELDLHTVLDRLNVERCILYAQSTFTHVAIRYAADHPERVLALILWNPSDRQHGWQAESLVEFARADWDAFVVTASRIGFWLMGVDVVLPIMRETITQADWLKMMNAVAESDALERLQKVQAPTLVLLAPTRQPVVSEEATRRVAAEDPGRDEHDPGRRRHQHRWGRGDRGDRRLGSSSHPKRCCSASR